MQRVLNNSNNKMRIQLDPRTKFILLFLVVAMYTSRFPVGILLLNIVLGALLLVVSGYTETALKSMVLLTIVALVNWQVGYLPQWIGLLWGVMTVTLQFLLPVVLYMALIVKTSSVDDVSAMLTKFKAPSFLAIPMLVMLRFIPTIAEEYRHIRQAMVFRGIGLGVKNILRHPLKTIEYIYVPLLFSLVQIGEELTMSALTRGLGLYKKRTIMHDIKMHAIDYALIALYIAIFVAGLSIKGAA